MCIVYTHTRTMCMFESCQISIRWREQTVHFRILMGQKGVECEVIDTHTHKYQYLFSCSLVPIYFNWYPVEWDLISFDFCDSCLKNRIPKEFQFFGVKLCATINYMIYKNNGRFICIWIEIKTNWFIVHFLMKFRRKQKHKRHKFEIPLNWLACVTFVWLQWFWYWMHVKVEWNSKCESIALVLVQFSSINTDARDWQQSNTFQSQFSSI